MRVAALYDVHGNLPALRAVLAEVASEEIDTIVIGGDIATGPMPRETLDLLKASAPQARYLRGNADREAVAAYDEGRLDPTTEKDPVEQEAASTAARLRPDHRDWLAHLPTTVCLNVDRLGPTVFCHGSPRSDAEIVTSATPDVRLAEVLSQVSEETVVGGHTHRQFDRRVGQPRLVNAVRPG